MPLWTWQHIAETGRILFLQQDQCSEWECLIPSDLIGGYIYSLFQSCSQKLCFIVYSVLCFWLFCFGTHLWAQQDQ